MLVITASNVNDAWRQAKRHLNTRGVVRPSRAGEVIEFPEPVTTMYQWPDQCVLFDERRDCNPVFHFFEALWMLAGRNDVGWIKQFNSRIDQFSDDGTILHGAYGHRWRHHFGRVNQYGDGGIDQFLDITELLRGNPNERRANLQMWDPLVDLSVGTGKDVPCNTNAYFKIREDRLIMTVCNRSNDIVWGCYGANAVHMSILQEYMAARIGVEVGPYHQVSDSWHAYTATWEKAGGLEQSLPHSDLYIDHDLRHFPLVTDIEAFDEELHAWMEDPGSDQYYKNDVFVMVAVPMFHSWQAYKDRNFKAALGYANRIMAEDWRLACSMWMERRAAKAKTVGAGTGEAA